MLTEADLVTLLSPFADQLAPAFKAFPTSGADAALEWAWAATEWTRALVPVSITHDLAFSAFLKEMLACTVGQDREAFPRAWVALAAALAPGMVGWTAVPPPAAPDFTSVYELGLHGEGSNRQCLEQLAAIALAWLRTGTAVQQGTSLTLNWQ